MFEFDHTIASQDPDTKEFGVVYSSLNIEHKRFLLTPTRSNIEIKVI